MNKVTYYYRQLITALTERLTHGEHDIEKLVDESRQRLLTNSDLSHEEVNEITRSVRRDLAEFARSYRESYHQHNEDGVADSVFMRIVRQSLWKELADVTDKSQLEWQEVFQDLNHHGVYRSGEVVGLGNLVCEKCHFTRAIYTPEVLSPCPECGNDLFQRQPFSP